MFMIMLMFMHNHSGSTDMHIIRFYPSLLVILGNAQLPARRGGSSLAGFSTGAQFAA